MLGIEEFKKKVVEIATDLGNELPYDEDSETLSDTWEELSEEVIALARHTAVAANRFAAYAGIAAKKRNSGL